MNWLFIHVPNLNPQLECRIFGYGQCKQSAKWDACAHLLQHLIVLPKWAHMDDIYAWTSNQVNASSDEDITGIFLTWVEMVEGLIVQVA